MFYESYDMMLVLVINKWIKKSMQISAIKDLVFYLYALFNFTLFRKK